MSRKQYIKDQIMWDELLLPGQEGLEQGETT